MKGIFSAAVTPFDKNGAVNTEALKALIRKNIAEGASGFFVGGSSSECFLMTESERIAVYEAAAAFCDETHIIAHIGALSTDMAIRLAKAAKSFGIRHIGATPPFYYTYPTAQIIRYYRDIYEETGMPVMIYNFPVFTGKTFDLGDPDIRALFASDAVWGIKHTDQNLFMLERLRDIKPGLVILAGYDETLAGALALGADGAIGSNYNIITPHFKKLFDAFDAGDMKTVRDLQLRANSVIEVISGAGGLSAIKYVLTRQGIDAGEPRRPFLPLTDAQKKSVDAALARYI